jgi:four helix bundle protein
LSGVTDTTDTTDDAEDAESRDPLSRMRVYQLARELRSTCWEDAEILRSHPICEKIAPQLYEAVGSIAANIAEGYSRSSGKDRARIFEYALGSARESLEWYDAGEHVFDAERLGERRKILNEVIRMLLAIIPRERKRLIRPH